MSLIKKIKAKIKSVCRLVRNEWSKPILVVVNHQVSSLFNEEIDCKTDWSSIDLYEKNIQWIVKHYKVISLEQAIYIIRRGKRIREKYAVFTFDDGYASIENALHILEKYNLPATIFINTAYLDDKKLSPVNAVNFIQSKPERELSKLPSELVTACYNIDDVNENNYKKFLEIINQNIDYIRPSVSVYLSEEKLEKLNKDLFTIGLHGHEHLISTFLDKEQFLENVNKNIKALQNYENYKPFFAFPYGNANEEKILTVKALGLVPVLCNGLKNNINSDCINRIPIDGIDLEKIRI